MPSSEINFPIQKTDPVSLIKRGGKKGVIFKKQAVDKIDMFLFQKIPALYEVMMIETLGGLSENKTAATKPDKTHIRAMRRRMTISPLK